MNLRRNALAVSLSFLVLSCQQETATGPSESGTHAVAARISSGSIPSAIWTSTDSVHLTFQTTGTSVLLLDTGLSLVGKTGVLTLKTVQVANDQGVSMVAAGFYTGTKIWSGSSTATASSSDTTLTLTAALAVTTGLTVGAPAISSFDATAWKTDTFDLPVHVFLSSATGGAVIHYTLDGTTPDAASPTYGDTGILVDSSRTLKTVAIWAGIPSPVLSRTFVLQAQDVTVDSISNTAWTADTYDQPVTVTLSSVTPNAEIHYTLSGAEPTRDSLLYNATSGILIDSTRTLKAVVFTGKAAHGTVLAHPFALRAQAPSFAASAFEGWPPFRIAINGSPTPDADIRYTLDGRDPTSADPLYVDSLPFGANLDTMTVKAAVFPRKPGIAPSTTTTRGFGVAIPWNKAITYGALTDTRDGHVYKTVKIGTKTWMAQNLNYAGAGALAKEQYYNRKIGAYGGITYTDSAVVAFKYGRVYTWSEVMNGSSPNPSGVKGICPTGWHIPSDAEWQSLEVAVGMSASAAASTIYRGTTEGTKLKSLRGWNRYDSVNNMSCSETMVDCGKAGSGTDDYGFRALPAGGGTSPWTEIDLNTYFWTATTVDDGTAGWDSFDAWIRGFGNSYAGIYRGGDYKTNPQNYLRCVAN